MAFGGGCGKGDAEMYDSAEECAAAVESCAAAAGGGAAVEFVRAGAGVVVGAGAGAGEAGAGGAIGGSVSSLAVVTDGVV